MLRNYQRSILIKTKAMKVMLSEINKLKTVINMRIVFNKNLFISATTFPKVEETMGLGQFFRGMAVKPILNPDIVSYPVVT